MDEPSAKSREEAGKGASFAVSLYMGKLKSVKHIIVIFYIKYVERNVRGDGFLNARGSRCGKLVPSHDRLYLL